MFTVESEWNLAEAYRLNMSKRVKKQAKNIESNDKAIGENNQNNKLTLLLFLNNPIPSLRGNKKKWFPIHLQSRKISRGLFWHFVCSNVHGGLWSYHHQDERRSKKKSPFDLRAIIPMHIRHRSHGKAGRWQSYQGVSGMVTEHEEGTPWRRWD